MRVARSVDWLTDGCGYWCPECFTRDRPWKEQAGSVRHDILVSPPNRLVHLLEQGLLSLDNLQWLVVDEADKMFEAGVTGFRFCILVQQL